MISLDTETTGIDLHHGAKPFFVTTCDEEGEQQWWEWDVDPLTREPTIPGWDVTEIRRLLLGCDSFVGQNFKFDAAALHRLGINWHPFWTRTHDTLVAGHILASNQPHDLTSMACHYLGVDIEPFEHAIKKAVKEARNLVSRKAFVARHGEWAIAKRGRPDMPSAKEETWGFDYWLPKAVATHLSYPDDHPWHTALRDYANADSAVTVQLWKAMRRELERRKLWDAYATQMRLPPILVAMERRGVTVSKRRLEELEVEYEEQARVAGEVCVGLAKNEFDYDLTLPKAGNNKSLLHFCFGEPAEGDSPLFPKKARRWLDLPIVARTETGNPSLDAKNAIPAYLDTLAGVQLQFIEELAAKRKLDTSLSYLEGYKRYWLPLKEVMPNSQMRGLRKNDISKLRTHLQRENLDEGGGGSWFVLHPSLNQTGTDTLRFSSSNPNSQNFSKKKDKRGRSLRYALGPAPSREWWSLDYENIELRIPAYEAGETAMIELFERPDDPPYFGSNHLLFFDILHPAEFARHGAKVKEVYKDTLYQWTKNGDFAVQYGAVAESGTADRAYHMPGAQAKIEKRLTNIKRLNERMIAFAEKHGFVNTMCGYPLLCTRTEYGRIKPTVPLSYHVQGTAMGCTRRAMVRCDEQLLAWTGEDQRGYFMCMQVHDEIVFDFPAGGRRNLPKVMKLKRLMEASGDDIGVPLKVSVAWHPANWAETADYSLKPSAVGA